MAPAHEIRKYNTDGKFNLLFIQLFLSNNQKNYYWIRPGCLSRLSPLSLMSNELPDKIIGKETDG